MQSSCLWRRIFWQVRPGRSLRPAQTSAATKRIARLPRGGASLLRLGDTFLPIIEEFLFISLTLFYFRTKGSKKNVSNFFISAIIWKLFLTDWNRSAARTEGTQCPESLCKCGGGPNRKEILKSACGNSMQSVERSEKKRFQPRKWTFGRAWTWQRASSLETLSLHRGVPVFVQLWTEERMMLQWIVK